VTNFYNNRGWEAHKWFQFEHVFLFISPDFGPTAECENQDMVANILDDTSNFPPDFTNSTEKRAKITHCEHDFYPEKTPTSEEKLCIGRKNAEVILKVINTKLENGQSNELEQLCDEKLATSGASCFTWNFEREPKENSANQVVQPSQ